jgi:hypothetical protein
MMPGSRAKSAVAVIDYAPIGMKGLSMHLARLLAEWFWRVDAFLDGGAKPRQGQRFSTAHPVRLGLIVGPAFGGLFGVIALGLAMAGAEYALTLTSLAVCVGSAVVIGTFFMGMGYIERWRQQHYGHYPPEVQ